MLPVEAADLWMKYLEPLRASGVRLGGPAVTAAGTGRPWLVDFFKACSNCTIDFLPLHWFVLKRHFIMGSQLIYDPGMVKVQKGSSIILGTSITSSLNSLSG